MRCHCVSQHVQDPGTASCSMIHTCTAETIGLHDPREMWVAKPMQLEWKHKTVHFSETHLLQCSTMQWPRLQTHYSACLISAQRILLHIYTERWCRPACYIAEYYDGRANRMQLTTVKDYVQHSIIDRSEITANVATNSCLSALTCIASTADVYVQCAVINYTVHTHSTTL